MKKIRNVIITGGGTGIGYSIAQRFCEAGDNVIIVGRRKEVLQDAVKKLSATGAASYIVTDASQPEAVKSLLSELKLRDVNQIDVLVNNAGASIKSKGSDLQNVADQYIQSIETNLLTAVLMTEGLKDVLTSPGGKVINFSSIAATKGGGIAYSAAKGAIISWSYALATELAPKKINVNVIAPGYVPETEFFADTMTDERHQKLLAGIPLGRAGKPADIAGAVFFMASSEADFITGQVLQVNGGAHYR